MKILLLGNGRREAIIASKLIKELTLFLIMPYRNYTIDDCCVRSGGKVFIGSPFDKEFVNKILDEEKIDFCFINNDDLLASGLIDVARNKGIKTFGPIKSCKLIFDFNMVDALHIGRPDTPGCKLIFDFNMVDVFCLSAIFHLCCKLIFDFNMVDAKSENLYRLICCKLIFDFNMVDVNITLFFSSCVVN